MSESEPSHHGPADDTKRTYPNETMQLLHERASCRSFEDRPIPEETLEAVLESGLHAATGGNLQPYSIIRIENKTAKQELVRLCRQPFIADAPVDLLFCLDFRRLKRWAELEKAPFAATHSFHHFWIGFQDTIIAAQNICTAADAVGLGSVYIGTITWYFREVCALCELPEAVFPVVLLCLGYPKHRPLPRKKLGTKAVVHREKYCDLSDQDLLDAFNEKYSHQKVQITEERMRQYTEVCRKLHGDDFAQDAAEKVQRAGFFNAVQRYFGLHYVADLMAGDNEGPLEIMKERGFGWFEYFKPPFG